MLVRRVGGFGVHSWSFPQGLHASAVSALYSVAGSVYGQDESATHAAVSRSGDDTTSSSVQSRGKPKRDGRLETVLAVAFDVGTLKRMEDRYTMESSYQSDRATKRGKVDMTFAGVYDGHGSHTAADITSKQLPVVIGQHPIMKHFSRTGERPSVDTEDGQEDLRTAFKESFKELDAAITKRLRGSGTDCGTTAVVVVRIKDILAIAHVGDSRAVLSKNGKPVQLTTDHVPNLPQEASRIERLGGRIDYSRRWRVMLDEEGVDPNVGLMVTRSLGDWQFKEGTMLVENEPYVRLLELKPGDEFVILATDGVWDNMKNEEAVDLVKEELRKYGKSSVARSTKIVAQRAAQKLVRACKERKGHDNTTCIIMWFPYLKRKD